MRANPQLEWCCHQETVREILLCLTPRQFEVVALTYEGYTPAQAAEALGLSDRRVAHQRLKLAAKKVLAQFPELEPKAEGRKRPLSRQGGQDG